MQEKHLFEYAVIRIVPRVEREEFINAGVILYCSSKSFLKTCYHLDPLKLNAISKDIDITELEERLVAFRYICEGWEQGGPIAKLPLASRFRWLTSTRSTIIQLSAVHPGFCAQPEMALERLYQQLVIN